MRRLSLFFHVERDVLRAMCFLLLAGSAIPAAAAASRIELPEGPGRNLVYGQCQTCHDLQSLRDSAGIPRGAWDAVLDNMHDFGLRVSAEQRAQILDYLATYLGANPPAESAVASGTGEGPADGAAIFSDICSACHAADGSGKAGEFPPLAGNRDLFLSPEFPVRVVLSGMSGPIETTGDYIDKAMPSFDFLSDEEIAAVVDFVRGQWGNDALSPSGMSKITPSDVSKAREKSVSAEDVHALRKSLLP